MVANSNKLMHGCQPTDYGKISNCDVSCQSHTICNDYIIAYQTIVCYVCISHNKTIVAHDSLTRCCCTTIDRYTLTNSSVITYNRYRVFATEFQILWYCRNNSTRKNRAIFTNSRPFHYGYVRSNPSAFTYFHIVMNGSKWFNYYILSNFCTRMNVC